MNQGSVRRGYFSAYQDISHPDFEEWLNIRAEGDPIQHITWGACVSDEWLKSMRDGDVKKRKIWARVIQKKFETGLPYIFFTDNANNHESVPEVYRGKGKILSSQMCLAENSIVTIIFDGEQHKVDIKTAIELFKSGQEILVKSYCIESDEVEFTKILNGALMNKEAEVLTIEDEETGKSIICTPEHQVYTVNRGYVMAKDLKEDDILKILK
jgi:ribonucleotide reductase alpha subunit